MDYQHLLQQAANLKKKLDELEDQLARFEASASAGGDAAQVRVNGQFQVVELNLDAELVGTQDLGLIQETIQAALNQALATVREHRDQQRAGLTGGFSLPEL